MLPMPFNNPATYPGHSGVDFGQSRGTTIPASGPGVVSALTYTPRAGYVTWVRYDECPSVEVGYCHQDAPDRPNVGTRVKAGDWLGSVGSTGTASTGPHLHLEIDPGGTYTAVWEYFDPNRVVGYAGGTTLPGGFLMALSDAEQQQLLMDVHNITAYLWRGGPDIDAGIGSRGTIFGRLLNVDRQLTGADGQKANLVQHVLDAQKQIATITAETDPVALAAAIATALPGDMAKQVVAELGKRIGS